jgi:hypothetical protein
LDSSTEYDRQALLLSAVVENLYTVAPHVYETSNADCAVGDHGVVKLVQNVPSKKEATLAGIDVVVVGGRGVASERLHERGTNRRTPFKSFVRSL